jgi:hypothetical protein
MFWQLTRGCGVHPVMLVRLGPRPLDQLVKPFFSGIALVGDDHPVFGAYPRPPPAAEGSPNGQSSKRICNGGMTNSSAPAADSWVWSASTHSLELG